MTDGIFPLSGGYLFLGVSANGRLRTSRSWNSLGLHLLCGLLELNNLVLQLVVLNPGIEVLLIGLL